MASFGLSKESSATASATTEETIESSTPWMAAADGKLELLQRSLQILKLPVSAADENGYTLLQAAASYGHVPIMQWILTCNDGQPVNVNSVDQEGDSALHYAGSLSAVQILVQQASINVSLQNKQGKTALQQKQQELKTALEEEEEDSDSEDVISLKQQIEFLKNVPGA